jgi:hypothetical protein
MVGKLYAEISRENGTKSLARKLDFSAVGLEAALWRIA